MSDRDRLAAIIARAQEERLGPHLIADALIAAGVDFVCPACGSAQCSGADGQWCPLDKAAHEKELAAEVTMPASDGSADWDACDNCPKCGEIDV